MGEKDTEKYAASWSATDVVGFFSENRDKVGDVYDSEKYFLDKFLDPEMSVLDFGCAAGGFLQILSEEYGIAEDRYHGVDISPEMLAAARGRFPQASFAAGLDGHLAADRRFDFVYSFGVLHMTLRWQEYLARLYKLAGKYLVFDLRFTQEGGTVADIDVSYQELSFAQAGDKPGRVPYVVINADEAADVLGSIVSPGDEILQYGYEHKVSQTVVSPYRKVLMAAYCVVKNDRDSGLAA